MSDATDGDVTGYESPDDWEEVGDPRQVFAPGHIEEWDIAMNDLREALEELENVDWESWEDVAEAEEIIDNRLSEIQRNLHDAFDSVKEAKDV